MAVAGRITAESRRCLGAAGRLLLAPQLSDASLGGKRYIVAGVDGTRPLLHSVGKAGGGTARQSLTMDRMPWYESRAAATVGGQHWP